jgi:hypothetical protein
MTPLELQEAWEKLNAFSNTIGGPKGFTGPMTDAYVKWLARLDEAYTKGTPGSDPFIPMSEMELWMKSYGDHKVSMDQAAVKYKKIVPKVTEPASSKVIQGEEIRIYGALPWWYWPLRVGAGVGAGYALYRVLTPTEREQYAQRRQALAGR